MSVEVAAAPGQEEDPFVVRSEVSSKARPNRQHRPDDVTGAGAFLWRDMVVGVHRTNEQGEECVIDPKSPKWATGSRDALDRRHLVSLLALCASSFGCPQRFCCAMRNDTDCRHRCMIVLVDRTAPRCHQRSNLRTMAEPSREL